MPLNRNEKIGISPETQEFLGIKPLRIFYPPDQQPQNSLQASFTDKFLKTLPKIGGQIVDDIIAANTIIFLVDPTQSNEGMFKYPNAFKQGVSGVAIGVVPEIPEGTDMVRLTWETLGNAATQYGILIIGDPNLRQIRKVHTISMEGSHPEINFEKLGEEVGFEEVARRMTHLAAAQKVTNWSADKTMPAELWQKAQVPLEVIYAGKELRKMGLLPDVKPEDYVSEERARRIKLFMEVSGLSIGNLSGWDDEAKFMWVTGSGFDKGNLKREQIVAIKGFNETFDGPVVWATADASRVKPSVETFDQLLAYWASALIKTNYLNKAGLQELIAKSQDRSLMKAALSESPIDKSIIHLHLQPEEWEKDIFTVVDVNPDLVPNRAYHSSCGTRPLAFYTVEALIRATLKSPYDIKIARLPNHGIFIASPLALPESVDILDPKAGKIKFKQVNPV